MAELVDAQNEDEMFIRAYRFESCPRHKQTPYKMKNRITILSFLVAYILLCYLDKILLDDVKRYENFVLATVVAGVVYVVQLLTSLPKK